MERPILFSAPMVRAILAGAKTQTRRLVRFRPGREPGGALSYYGRKDSNGFIEGTRDRLGMCHWHAGWAWQTEQGWCNCIEATYAQPFCFGELWVRETWHKCDDPPGETCYRATSHCTASDRGVKWRPSIFLPRDASRITLRVTDIRVERLQDISEADAMAEGIEGADGPPDDDEPYWRCYGDTDCDGECVGVTSARESYRTLWNSINAKRAPWASNPWVWVVSFERAPTLTKAEAR